jgi:hypothetical protein
MMYSSGMSSNRQRDTDENSQAQDSEQCSQADFQRSNDLGELQG